MQILSVTREVVPGTRMVKPIYFDGATPKHFISTTYLGRTQTGYLVRKLWAGNSQFQKNTVTIADPIFRLAELYLNYAEAANEAYGPKTAAPGATLTAEGAINAIRARAGMPAVLAQFTDTKEHFRPRIWNERNVELSWEGHYYNDIRRWKILQDIMSSTLIGMIPQKVAVDLTYPTGFMYARYPCLLTVSRYGSRRCITCHSTMLML